MSSINLKNRYLDTNLLSIAAISAASLVNIYLIFLVVDANYGYNIGVSSYSPALRAFALFTITIILFIKIAQTKILNLDIIVLIFILYIFIGSVVGYFNNGVSYEFIRHLFAAATMLVSYWAGRFLSFDGRWIKSTLRWWAWISVMAGVLAWVMAYWMIDAAAFSMSPVSQILPFSVGLTTGSMLLVVLALLMIALGNKRDVILGAAAIFAVMVVRRYLAKMNGGLRIVAGGILTVIFALVIFLTVAQGSQLLAKLLTPLPTNLAERANRVLDFVDEEFRKDEKTIQDQQDQKGITANQQHTTKHKYEDNADTGSVKHKYEDNADTGSVKHGYEDDVDTGSLYWRLESLSSSRASLAYSVYHSVNETEFGFLFGKGFGSSYEWTYWSNNLNAWQTVVHYQCDLMPLWFLLTSGIIVSILLTGGISWRIFQIFLYSTKNKLEVAALLVIGSSFGMFLSFQPNVPLFWIFVGSMAARIQRSQASQSTR